MRIFSIIICIGYSLLFLTSCNSNAKNNSIVHKQSELLKEFGASLTKIVTLEGKGIDTLNCKADSVEWEKELGFLSYIDQLNEANFELNHQYTKDSVLIQTIYTPMDSSSTIQHVQVDFKKGNTLYQYNINKNRLTQDSNQKIKVNFRNYQNQKIVQSYSVKGFQKSPTSDSIFYSVEGKTDY